MLLGNKCFLSIHVFKCHILELIIYVVDKGRIILHIQFIEGLNEVFVDVFMVIFFNLFFLFFERNILDSLLYVFCVFFSPRILFHHRILFILDRKFLRDNIYKTYLNIGGYN